MNPLLDRRRFLKCSASGALALAGCGLLPGSARAVEPFVRSGKPRLLLSLAAYSFREFFRDSNHPQTTTPAATRKLDLSGFIDFCANHGCLGAELTSYYFPREVTRNYLLQLRREAFLRGISISGTAVGNSFTLPAGEKRQEQIALVKTWIEHAHVMGAPHIRVFAGGAENAPKAEARKHCIAALEECAAAAAEHGIFLGLENHGGIVAEAPDLLEIVRAVQSPWVGINLDSGNFHTDDPYADMASCAPYAVNVQIKAEIRRRGKETEPADLKKIISILRDANYQGFVALEYESAEDPYVAVPRLLDQIRPLLA